MKVFWVLVVVGLLFTVASVEAQMWRWDPIFDKEVPQLSPGLEIKGDVNKDGLIGPGDIDFLISYLFENGDAPDPIYVADINGDERIDEYDITHLIDSVYLGVNLPEKYSSIINDVNSLKGTDQVIHASLMLHSYFKRIIFYDNEMRLRSNDPVYVISWFFCGQTEQERIDSKFISDHSNELKKVPYILLRESEEMSKEDNIKARQIINSIEDETEKIAATANTKIRNAGGICGG